MHWILFDYNYEVIYQGPWLGSQMSKMEFWKDKPYSVRFEPGVPAMYYQFNDPVPIETFPDEVRTKILLLT